MCVDHSCPLCGTAKHPRQGMCSECKEASKSLPAHNGFACELLQPLRLDSAYRQYTGAWSLFQSHEMDGMAWKHWWAESKDHIFASPDFHAAWVLPPPNLAHLDAMPSLFCASDHIAMVAFEMARVVIDLLPCRGSSKAALQT